LSAAADEISDKAINSLVDAALEVLGRIVRARLH
jgi:hypothetical protein